MFPQAQPASGSVLVIDDRSQVREVFEHAFRQRGYKVSSCAGVLEALPHMKRENFDVILADHRRCGQAGMELLERTTYHAGRHEIVSASFDEIAPPDGVGQTGWVSDEYERALGEILGLVEQACMWKGRPRLGAVPPRPPAAPAPPATTTPDQTRGARALAVLKPTSDFLVGESLVMRQLMTVVERVAQTDSYVMVTGETGVGKELVARAIHERSRRSGAPFVDINCSAIPDTLVEAEMFGHQRGTFTGAHETRRGLFEEASGGTIFLDEVDALSLSAQAKLLRVLQERTLRRVGGRENIPVDVRVISATNHDLHAANANGTFRHDLLFRLRVVPLHVPPLRDRIEDLPHLIDHFLEKLARSRGLKPRRFTLGAMRALKAYGWPGNVRELENVVEYALAISASGELTVDDLPPEVLSKGPRMRGLIEECLAGSATLEEMERRYILSTFERLNRHHGKTAAALGIDRRTLYRKLRQYGGPLP